MIALGHSVSEPRLDFLLDESDGAVRRPASLEWTGETTGSGLPHEVFRVPADECGYFLFR
jgi:hypothetical protein